MDKNALIRVLRGIANEPARQTESAPAETAAALDAFDLRTISQPIAETLSRDAPFDGGHGFFLQSANAYTGFYAPLAATRLCQRILRGEPPGQAVEWLEKLLVTDATAGHGVLALRGVKIDETIDLGYGITMMSFTSLPDSEPKSLIVRSLEAFHKFPHSAPMLTSLPEVALMSQHVVRPLLLPTKLGEPPKQEDPLALYRLLDDAGLALTLLGPCAPVHSGFWFQFDDPDVNEAVLPGIGLSMRMNEVNTWSLAFSSPYHLQPVEAKDVVSDFLALRDPLRTRMRLALRRLHQAVLRP